MTTNKRVVTGIKPTGEIHIGNYFGMIKEILALQERCEVFVFIADYHALNQIQNRETMEKYSWKVAEAYLAAGLDAQKKNVALFRQSDISPVSELCWILNCVTPLGLLKTAHAYKDAIAKGRPVNMGLFDYPVLMAADILAYGAEIVPVGEDQTQHIEIAREIARRFNKIFGQTFKLPQALIDKNMPVVKGLDGRKMSKSYANTIGLFDSEKEVERKVMSIITDSRGISEPKDPVACHIFSLHKLFSQKQLKELEKRYLDGTISYRESKEILAENINKFLEPIRQKKLQLEKNPALVRKVLETGRQKALKVAQKTLAEVKRKIGLAL